MIDASEFDCIDEHLSEDIDDGDVMEDELWGMDEDDVLIVSTTETHTGFWDDLSEVNPDDIPF